jgi:hypothetical protein
MRPYEGTTKYGENREYCRNGSSMANPHEEFGQELEAVWKFATLLSNRRSIFCTIYSVVRGRYEVHRF